METLEDIRLYFYIACGITAVILLILIILVCVLFVKVNALLAADGSNQLSRQANMMADFCYTNPSIVPGEELSRRGFSMYRGSDYTSSNMFGLKKDYAVHQEQRSKF